MVEPDRPAHRDARQLLAAPGRQAPARLRDGLLQHDQQLRRGAAGLRLHHPARLQRRLTLLLRQYGWMEDFNLYSKTGLIILYTYFQIPLGVMLLYPAFDALREDWRESAALLGASRWRYWRHIGLPVLTPALLGTFVILLANALGAYATVYSLTTGNFNVIPIRIAALVAGDVSLDPNMASALAMVLVGLMTLITLVHQWLLRRSYLMPAYGWSPDMSRGALPSPGGLRAVPDPGPAAGGDPALFLVATSSGGAPPCCRTGLTLKWFLTPVERPALPRRLRPLAAGLLRRPAVLAWC